MFFGLQYFLKRYLAGVVVTEEKINEAEMIYKGHFGPGSSFPRDKVTKTFRLAARDIVVLIV